MQETTNICDDQQIFERCREIELLSKKLYQFFADIYSDDADIKALWLKTAAEEQNHADQFTLAMKLKKNLAVSLNIDLQKADFIVGQLQKVMQKFNDNPPKLEEALSASIKMENYLADFHLVCVATFEDQNFKNMFKAMMAGDQKHIASLQDAYDRLTSR